MQSILGLLKYGRSRDFQDKLEFLLRCLLESGAGELHLGHLKAVVVYISLKEGQIHLIQALQEILGLPLSDAATLEDRSLEQLQSITGKLRQQFRDRK